MIRIKLPEKVEYIINMIEDSGFSAYAVGGCIRDTVLNRKPNDWDIAASAGPAQIKRIFEHTADTGLRHGTVTVIHEGFAVEVTTFRTEGKYSDSRRPDSVVFIDNIETDLARRDFTVNAVAYNIKEGIVDPFGGLCDINRGIIKAVGDPEERFEEDALRILRAVRFSAALGFNIENETLKACARLSHKLKEISGERIFTELNKTFMYAKEYHIKALKDTNIFLYTLPEALETNLTNIAEKLESSISDAVRWTLLCGGGVKPALKRLKASSILQKKASELAGFLNRDIIGIKKAASSLKYASFEEVCSLKADKNALNEYKTIKANHEPVLIKDLKISGAALMEAGFSGKEIGFVQKKLLAHVWDYPRDNNESKLLNIALKMRGEGFGN